jgi:hypothetical protein
MKTVQEALNELVTGNQDRAVIDDLIRGFAAAVGGNKRYLQEVRQILEERFKDLSARDVDTLYFLVRGLKNG